MQRMKSNRSVSRGLTLVELLVVIAIFGIIAVMALPAYKSVVANTRIAAFSNKLVGAINLARSEAVKTSAQTAVGASSTNWSSGYSVWRDANEDGVFDNPPEELIRVFGDSMGDVTITSTTTSIEFRPTGFVTQAASIDICSDDEGLGDRRLSVALSGRVTVSEYTCP